MNKVLAVLLMAFMCASLQLAAQPGCIGFKADFSYTKDNTIFPPQFHFTNTSLWTDSTTVYLWDYGDGNIAKVKQEAHVYTNQGTYNVCLYARNVKPNGDTTCRDTACTTLTVEFDTCIAPINTEFIVGGDLLNCFQKWFATNTIGTLYYYLWTFDNGDSVVIQSPSHTHTYTQKGSYNVCLEVYYLYGTNNTKRCSTMHCDTVEVCPTLGVEGIDNAFNVIYPNPFNDNLLIQNSEATTYTLSDISGRGILNGVLAGEAPINTSGIAPGVYFITLAKNGTVVYRQRVIK